MEQKTQEILKRFLKKNGKVVLGLSGGPDSVFLLHQLLLFRKKIPFGIVIAHVNHKLRGKDSDLDGKFVKNLAEKHGLAFELATLPKIKKGNLEEHGRDFRYGFFEDVRKRHRADLILTAHHRDDSIETALFNLARGSYLNGLAGMETYTEEKHLLRPLLSFPKKDIIAFLKQKRFGFRIDKSNKDLSFARNRIREKIVPEFRKINSSFDENLLNFMSSLAETSALMEAMSKVWIEKNGTAKEGIPLKRFLDLPPVMQKNILASLYRSAHGDTRNFNRRHLEQVLSVLNRNKNGLKKEFGRGWTIVICKDKSREKRILAVRECRG